MIYISLGSMYIIFATSNDPALQCENDVGQSLEFTYDSSEGRNV